MMRTTARRTGAAVAGGLAFALALTACSGSDLGGGGGDGDDGGGDAACEDYADYGTFEGDEVTILSSIREQEADQMEDTFVDFEECTGIDVVHNGIGEFETQVVVQAEGGNAPNLAIIPQPGLLARLVTDGYIVEPSEQTVTNAQEGWTEEWLNYGTVDGTFYAAPLMASVKSFVWYSPTAFAENGYEVPTTWDELIALSDQIVADHGADGVVKPWCAGIESGGATGWPATDFIEDMVLREAGPEVYDQWVTHEIPFNDPQIYAATERAGSILRNEDYVNGGIGDSRSIATTSFNDGGLPILDGNCFMYRMASFYEAQWPEGTDVSPEGDAFAFYLPGDDADSKPLLTAGEFVGAFDDNEATQAVQAFMSSGEWANLRVTIGGVTSANNAVDPANASSDVLRLAIELLQDPDAVTRFDGSDLMPSAVGAGSFWTGMTEWIDGADTQTVLDQIEASWPAS
nr:ABC transporter substrate-binding protein [Occultella kanbiaonis]